MARPPPTWSTTPARWTSSWLDGVTTVGVTSGASVPEELVTSVLGKLAGDGFGAVEEVEAVPEHMTFALPRELRPARSSAAGGSASSLNLRCRESPANRWRQASARFLIAAIPGSVGRYPRPIAITMVSAVPVNSQGGGRAQHDQHSLGRHEAAGRGQRLGAYGPGQEQQRRAHHHGPQPAGPGVARDHAAAADERRARQRVPPGPGRDEQDEEAEHEQRHDGAPPGELDPSLRFQGRGRFTAGRRPRRGPGVRHRAARIRPTGRPISAADPGASSSAAPNSPGSSPATSSGADSARAVSSTGLGASRPASATARDRRGTRSAHSSS